MSRNDANTKAQDDTFFSSQLESLPGMIRAMTSKRCDRHLDEFIIVTRSKLLEDIKAIETSLDFMKFLGFLSRYSYDADVEFGDGMASDVIASSSSFVNNMHLLYSAISDRDPGTPTWRIFAEILAYGLFYDIDSRAKSR